MSKLEAIKAIVTANPVDLVAAVVEAAGASSNDAKAKAEFEELVQDMVLELNKKWKDFEDRDRPTQDDIIQGLAKLAETYRRTNNGKKRKILWNAFWNTFNPKFYNEGNTNILWSKVEDLEYPDFIFLARAVKDSNPTDRNKRCSEGLGGRGNWRGDQFPLLESDEEAEYALRLHQVGLVEVESGTTGGVLLVSRKGLAAKVKDFALEEFWKEDAEAKPAT